MMKAFRICLLLLALVCVGGCIIFPWHWGDDDHERDHGRDRGGGGEHHEEHR